MRQFLLSLLVRSRRQRVCQQGFTLLELIVVIVIVGILSALAIPTYLVQRDRACYGGAQSQMDGMATELRTIRLLEGNYPLDVENNQPPDQLNFFPTDATGGVPCGSTYDYESWTNGSATTCYIQITYSGINGDRESGTVRLPTTGFHQDVPGLGDDMQLVIETAVSQTRPCT